MQKETDEESKIIINDEIIDDKNISTEISSDQILAEVIDHICDYNGKLLLHT